MPDSAHLIQTVAIVGPGLIGGSFALALRQAGFVGEILGVGASPYVERALSLRVISGITSLEQAVRSADVIYLSETVERIVEILEQIGPNVRENCVVSDVGSTKRSIVETASRFLRPGAFLGGHPMAGKEKRGVENAEASLFRDRPYILTSGPESAPEEEFVGWLRAIGAKVVYLDADEHDRAVAFSSHLPQLLSTALALTLSHQGTLPVRSVAGPGLRQTLRLARSSPELWSSILKSNQDHISSAIEAFTETLNQLRLNLSTPDIAEMFAEAGKYSYLLTDTDDSEPRM